jgi:hypothetical protein
VISGVRVSVGVTGVVGEGIFLPGIAGLQLLRRKDRRINVMMEMWRFEWFT